jgi:hypothetical protein
MQRWIILTAVVLVLLGGAGIFAIWKIKQQHPDFQYMPLKFDEHSTEEQREATVREMQERLLADTVLTSIVRDCGIVSKWGLPSESAAVEELRKRAILRSGTDQIEGVYTDTLQIGFKGVVAEHEDLEALTKRLMEDVIRLTRLAQTPEKTAAPAPANSF